MINPMRNLLRCGLVGVVLFLVVFTVEGAIRADYDPIRHPVSSLELSDRGWIQTANFIVTGILFLAFAVGVRKAGEGFAVPLFIGFVGIGLIGAGAFTTYPVNGYPPGASEEVTRIGELHDLLSMGVFLGLPLACLVTTYRAARARRFGWMAYSLLTALAFLVGFVLSGAGFSGDANFVPIGGLLQRITILIGWVWLAALAVSLLRRAPSR